MMGSDEPLATLLAWYCPLYVLMVIVGGQVQWIRTSDSIIYEIVRLDLTKFLTGIKVISLCVLVEILIGALTLLLPDLL